MNKHKKPYKYKNKGSFLIFLICELIWMLVFSMLFFSTKQATPQNTHFVDTKIIDVNTNYLQRNGYTVYLQTREQSYFIDWISYNESYSERNPNNALKGLIDESRVMLTCLNAPKKTIFSNNKIFEVVDVRTESKIYYNIDDYNKSMKENRVWGFIPLSIFWLFFTGVFAFVIYLKKLLR